MKPITIATLASAVFLSSPALAASPSFDCARAGTPTEHAICASDLLSGLDRQLADAFGAAGAGAGDGGTARIRDAQVAWIGQRDACGGDPGCIEGQMRRRLLELQAQAGGASAGGLTGSYCAGGDLLLVEDHGGWADVSLSSFQGGGHSCGTGRLQAARSGDGYRAVSGGCSFRLVPQAGQLVFTAGGEPGCRDFCGMRAMFGNHVFSIAGRRPLAPGWTTASETGGC